MSARRCTVCTWLYRCKNKVRFSPVTVTGYKAVCVALPAITVDLLVGTARGASSDPRSSLCSLPEHRAQDSEVLVSI